MDFPIIKANKISKKYSLSYRYSMRYGISDILSELLNHRSDPKLLRKNEFLALNDISFELYRGDCLGIIGANGAGKSTLLKVIAGISQPDSGYIKTRGKIASLIEIGAGFHPLLSGRENIFINGSIMGMSKTEIESKYQDIVAFTELGEFIEAPVRTYSSGMYLRLGFSIALHLDVDIFIVDEALSVGDINFRIKCLAKIRSKLDNGMTLLFVSHNLEQMSKVCNKGLMLESGKSASYGPIDEVIEKYIKNQHFELSEQWSIEPLKIVELKNKLAYIKQIKLIAHNDNSVIVRVSIEVQKEQDELYLTYGFREISGALIYGSKVKVIDAKLGSYNIDIIIDEHIFLKDVGFSCGIRLNSESHNLEHYISQSIIIKTQNQSAKGFVDIQPKIVISKN